jgi:hypothetical protein
MNERNELMTERMEMRAMARARLGFLDLCTDMNAT